MMILNESFEELVLLNDKSYHMDCYFAAEKQIGKFLYETMVSPSTEVDKLPDTIKAKVYEMKDIDEAYRLAVLLEGSEKYRVYVNLDYLKECNNT